MLPFDHITSISNTASESNDPILTLSSTDPQLVSQVEAAVKEEAAIISELNTVASQHPYYKFVLPLSLFSQ
jgi:hypothetical protein